MHRFLVVIFSLALLLTSSCAGKRYILQSVGMETSKTTKGSTKPFANLASTSFGCASTTNFEEFVVSSTQVSDNLNSFLFLLATAVLILSGIKILKENSKIPPVSFSYNGVPLYLRLGKLIYYN